MKHGGGLGRQVRALAGRSTRVALTLLALAGGAHRGAAAQVAAADTAAVLVGTAQRVDQEGNRRLAQAILRLVVRAYPDTPAAAEASRQLDQWSLTSDSTGGRIGLVVWGTLFGTWLGIGVPAALGADSPEPYGAGLLAGAPLGFLSASAYGRAASMSRGQARIIRFAGIWGAWQGGGWRPVLGLGEHNQTVCNPGGCFVIHQTSDRAPVASVLLGSIAGTGAGLALARAHQIAPGTAALVEFGGYWATWYGAAIGVVAGAENDALLTLMLTAGDVAVVAAAILAPGVDMSAGRATLITITGVAGLVAGLGLDLLLNVEDEKAAFGVPMMTSFVGLATGVAWTRDYDSRERENPGEPAAALLNVRAGRLGWGMPTPTPAMLPRSFDGMRVRHEVGIHLPLLHATF